MMQPFTTLTGVAAPLLRANIDTGTMIASRFMRSRSTDLGEKLFSDWRYNLDGTENADFILNKVPYRNSKIILGGPNFGCGSSREAAVWGLLRFGVRCVIAPSFGEIFFDNSCENGLLPIVLAESDVQALAESLNAASEPSLTISLENCVITAPGGLHIPFDIASDRRTSLLEGLDETSLILRYESEIDDFRGRDAVTRPWLYSR